jgi:hypothetical protein
MEEYFGHSLKPLKIYEQLAAFHGGMSESREEGKCGLSK